MVGWHHQLKGHESEQAARDGEGQGSLAFCSLRGRKESDTTEWVNNNLCVHLPYSCICSSCVQIVETVLKEGQL